jgi:hypothetical protein
MAPVSHGFVQQKFTPSTRRCSELIARAGGCGSPIIQRPALAFA